MDEILTNLMTQQVTVTLTAGQIILAAVAVIAATLLLKKKYNKMQMSRLTAKSTSKSDSDELKFQEALKLFLNTCEYKFDYWFERNILPVYISKGAEHVTTPLINKTFDDYKTDMKVCVHPKIYKLLLENYFSSSKSIDVFLKQYFHNKVNAYELKNKKTAFSQLALDNI